MHPFLETISVAGGVAAPLVLAIMVLTLFYRALGRLSRGATPNTMAVHGVLKKNTIATVHVSGHKPFDSVRFIGFTQNSPGTKTHLPWELGGMVILEASDMTRFIVRARDIKMIVVPPAAQSSEETVPYEAD